MLTVTKLGLGDQKVSTDFVVSDSMFKFFFFKFIFLLFYLVFTRPFNNSTQAYLAWHGLPVEKKEIKDDRGEIKIRFVDCKRK